MNLLDMRMQMTRPIRVLHEIGYAYAAWTRIQRRAALHTPCWPGLNDCHNGTVKLIYGLMSLVRQMASILHGN